jgi:hypothetical protein
MFVKCDGTTILDANYSRDKLKADNPNVSFPRDIPDETLAEYGAYRVVISAPEGQQWTGEYEVVNGLPVATYKDSAPYVPSVPNEVTMRQARLALFEVGLMSSVETALNALEEPAKTAARIEWEYSQTVRRDKEFVQVLSGALGLSSEDLDNLFTLASTK